MLNSRDSFFLWINLWSCCQVCRLQSAVVWEKDWSENNEKSKVTPKQSAQNKQRHRVWFNTLAVLLTASGSSSSQAARVTWVIDSTGLVKVSNTWLSWKHKNRGHKFNLDPGGFQRRHRWKAGDLWWSFNRPRPQHVGSKLHVKDEVWLRKLGKGTDSTYSQWTFYWPEERSIEKRSRIFLWFSFQFQTGFVNYLQGKQQLSLRSTWTRQRGCSRLPSCTGDLE